MNKASQSGTIPTYFKRKGGLASGIQENGFCILTDKAAYFIGKVHQKKWIFTFRTNVQHRIIASEMKGINVGTLSQFHMLLCVIATAIIEMFNIRHMIKLSYYAEYFGFDTTGTISVILLFFCCIIDVSLLIYFVLHAFILKRTNICIEFTSLTVAFLASELGKQEIKDFYKAVSEVQELYVNIVNPIPIENTVNEAKQSSNLCTDKITSLSELSKLYENGLLTKEEFEQLKQEVIGSQ